MSYRFEDIVDLSKIQKLLASHHGFSGMAYGLFDTDENNLLTVGWREICTQFHRVHPVSCARCRETDAFLKEQMQGITGEILECRCKNGMVEVALPIMVEDKHLATFFTGQFFYEEDQPERIFFINQARELGFDQDAYLAALDRVPVFSREHIRNNMQFLQDMVEMLAETGLANLQLKQETEERRLAEEALLRREAELQQRTDFQNKLVTGLQNADVVFWLAEGGRITYCNDARFGEPFGLTEADMAAQPEFINMVHPDDRPRITEIYQRRSAGEPMPTAFEVGVLWANGERREVEVVVSVIGYDPLKTLIIYKDITERKQYEAALLQRATLQEQLAAVAEAVPGFIYTARFDASGYHAAFPYASPGIVELLGVRPEEIRDNAAALRARYHHDDLPGLLERIDATRQNGGAFRYELRTLHPDKGLRWIEMRSTVQKLPDGTAVAHGVMIDITERKNAEIRLQEMKNRLSTIFATIPDLVWLKDTDGVYLSCNPAFEGFFGAAEADIVGKTDYDFVNPELAGFFRRKDREAMLADAVRVNEEEVIYASDGAKRLLETRKVPVHGADGTITGVLGLSRDITERKRMEDELQRKNSELERFTYTVSHDLKSPVITIKSFSGSIKNDLKSGRYDRIEKDLDRICTAADKMTLLLDDLLKLSRSGKVIDAPAPVDMRQLVNEVLKGLDGSLQESGVQIIVQPNLPTVMCDRQRMAEVLQNLIENAIKYRGNQPQPRIVIGLRQDGDQQVFFVQDNGPGIDPKYHENIFGLFNRLETRISGTGVGLALVKRIIEVHGGCVWVESDGCGNGSTFCFTVG